jgi:hypothetical protein
MPDETLSTFPTPQPPQEFLAGLPQTNEQLLKTQTTVGVLTTLPPLPPPPDSVQLHEDEPHQEYWCSKLFYDVSGLTVTPVNGPMGTSASVTREHAPYGYLIVRWGAKRLGLPPTIPSRDLQDPNAVYMRGWVSAAIPGHISEGGQWWSLEGCYGYALRTPYKEGDTLVIGAAPFVEEIAAENSVTAAMYDKNIVGPNQPPAGAPTDLITF